MKIPLFKIYWDEEDIKAVNDVIRSGKYWATGPQIENFEKAICNYLNVDNCVVFNSGGTSLETLMHAYGFSQGDEIIVPSFTFIATAYSPLYVGAKPVFCDIEANTFGLDPESVKEKITNKTKAIIPIHYGGLPCQIDALKEIAEDNNIFLIEDAAESFGSKYKNQRVGQFGDSAIFSFCHNKVFTTGEGGCIVTNNKHLYDKIKLINSYGRRVKGDYFSVTEGIDYVKLGNNYRLSSILAALGISQLKKIDKIIKMRRERANHRHNALNKISSIVPLKPPSNDFYHVYQMYTIRVLAGEKTRSKLIDYLRSKGITSKVYFDPVHKYSLFKEMGYDNLDLPITEEVSSQVLTLPLFPDMTIEEMDYLIKSVESFFEGA